MTQHFASVGAQKGTALHVVTQALENVGQAIDQLYDTSLPEVKGAYQRFAQGLALLQGVGPEGYAQLEEAEPGDGEQETPEISGAGVPVASEQGKPEMELVTNGEEVQEPVKTARTGRSKR